jgi:glutamine amidotransferase PdxT
MFDEITGSIDIVENKNFKIKNSINMSAQKVSSNYKISLEQLKEKDSFIGVFIDGPVLKVFNEDKILRSFESK